MLMAQQRLEQETWAREDVRGQMGRGNGGPIELQGGVGMGGEGRGGEVMLDGYAAPAVGKWDGRAVEMEGEAVERR